MKRLIPLTMLAAAAIVVPAQAAKPSHPAHPNKGHHGKCVAHSVGYNARGTLVSASLTPSGKKGRYDGTLTVDVKRANHKAPTGVQTFTLNNAKVHFGRGVDKTAPASGSWVRLHGKITVLPRGCSTAGFTQTITIRQVRISAARTKK